MKNIIIFTDAATSPQLSIAVGAFLILEDEEIQQYSEENVSHISAALSKKIIYKELQLQNL